MAAALVVGSTAITTSAANAAPEPPVASDVTYEGPVYRQAPYSEGTFDVELDATGGNGALTYQVVDQPTSGGASAGTATIEGNVATVKVSGTAQLGAASFTYKAVDADSAESNVATVSFDIANIQPLTRDLKFSTEQDTPLDIWPYARDAEDQGPFIWNSRGGTEITYGDPAHGEVTPFFSEEQGDFPEFVAVGHKAIYVPDSGYTGEDSFTYTLTDKDGDSSTTTITVNVTEPAPTARGEVNDIRYRCVFHVKTNEDGQVDPDGEYDENVTNLITRVMGGAVAFRIDVRAKAPKTLAPGEKFTVPKQEIDLKMPQGMAELLAGDDIVDNPPLENAGFGQTAVGGQATSDVHFTETATGNEYDVPLTGLKSKMMPMSLPVPSAGVTIPVKGGLPELTAPQSGKLVVSMPQQFDIDSILEPGVLGGVIKFVGLRCNAFEGEDLKLVSSKVVEQAATTTTATAPKVAYGQPAKVNVNVSDKAAGKVAVFKGKKRLGGAKLKSGKATIKLDRTALKPGKHRLQVKFAGSTRFKASKAKTTLRVTKAKATVRATNVGPKKVVAKKTRAKVRINVKAAGLKPGGKVTVRSGGKVIGKGQVRKGTLTLRVQKFATPGKKKLVVKYAGSSTIKAGSDRLRIRVVKRR
ncbi:Ig-like domain repeat protein [Solicola gregarius]|uniref:Ig-like domain repeat protein n=1 Tax=Solicola gregarius TaxID=2908642 RepID=A0AA46TDN3_9ACTN|nr:Ig-like domain repeat protein [Solicola gregarius]UYM03337.1 Ig-like domain repeat protein [Solicola gregarius]